MNCPRFDNILIISDFDGTYAGIKTRIIPENVEAIKRFIDLGGHFTFASGRSHVSLHKYYPECYEVVNAPMLMVNGTVFYDPVTKKILDIKIIDHSIVCQLEADMKEKFPQLTFYPAYLDEHTENFPDPNPYRSVIQCGIGGDPDIIKEAHAFYNEKYGDILNIVNPSADLIDITLKGCSKGARLKDLRQYFAERGYGDIKLFGIGDYENDLDLLRRADYAFCPANAIDSVKAACDHVVCHHDIGAIADMIRIIEEQYI